MTVLIGLNGFKGSGKNTAGKVIEQWGAARGLVVVQRAFADMLKLSAARSLGLYDAQSINDATVLMDSLKNSGTIDICIPEQSILKSISGREFLKWYGTEGHRDVFGSDFWVDRLLPLNIPWEANFSVYIDYNSTRLADIGVITDVRFANEARRVRQVGGVVWNIDRGASNDEHASEQPLPRDLVDLVISNRSTLEAFEVDVNSTMTAEFHMRFLEL